MIRIATLLSAVCLLFLCGCDDKQMSFRSIVFDVGQEPDIVVRVVSQDGATENFIISNEAGLGLMPLRFGNYCLDVYDKKGQALLLDHPKPPACFSVGKNPILFGDLGFDQIAVRFKGINEAKRIPLGFAHFWSEEAESANLSIGNRNPSVIVRVTPQDRKGEGFVESDRPELGDGIGRVPFRPGDYCFEAYGYKYKKELGGRIYAFHLEVESPTCFSVRENETTEVKVTILGELPL
jgi:hypothetical protein